MWDSVMAEPLQRSVADQLQHLEPFVNQEFLALKRTNNSKNYSFVCKFSGNSTTKNRLRFSIWFCTITFTTWNYRILWANYWMSCSMRVSLLLFYILASTQTNYIFCRSFDISIIAKAGKSNAFALEQMKEAKKRFYLVFNVLFYLSACACSHDNIWQCENP